MYGVNYVETGLGLALSAAFVGYLWRLALIQSQGQLVQLPGMMVKAHLLSLTVCLPIVVGAYAVLDAPASWFSLVVLRPLIGCWLLIGAFIGLWLSVRSSRAKGVITTPTLDR